METDAIQTVLPEDSRSLITITEGFRIESQSGLVTAASYLKRAKDSIKILNEKLAEELQPIKDRVAVLNEEIKKISEPFTVAKEAMKAIETRMDVMVREFNAKLEAERIQAQAIADKEFEKEQKRNEKIAEKTGTVPAVATHRVIEAPSLKGTGIAIREYQTFSIPGVVIKGEPIPGESLNRTNKKLKEIMDDYWILDLEKLKNVHKSKAVSIPGTIHAVKQVTAGAGGRR